MDEKIIKEIIPLLINWYSKHKRELPWRQNQDAYSIWISEIMLQQTRVETVVDYYNRFLKEIPDIQMLAQIPENQLLKLWQGLGYYSRAKNLQKAAKIIISSGKNTMPSSYEELLQLPGIGTYTAGAIASIAYQERVPAVDGNVLRVMTRLLGSYDDIADLKTKTKYEKFLKPYMPVQAGTFNQSMMELGATICIPNGLPRCNICPVASFCQAYQKGLLKDLPVKRKKTKRRKIRKTVFLYSYHNEIAIQKRPDQGLLASLYEFFNIDVFMTLEDVEKYLEIHKISYESINYLGTYQHIFTHLEWEMVCYHINLEKRINSYIWVTKEQLVTIYSLPTAFLKILT